jgi:hypothetical protein
MSRKKRSHNISEKANVSVTVIPLNYEEHEEHEQHEQHVKVQ